MQWTYSLPSNFSTCTELCVSEICFKPHSGATHCVNGCCLYFQSSSFLYLTAASAKFLTSSEPHTVLPEKPSCLIVALRLHHIESKSVHDLGKYCLPHTELFSFLHFTFNLMLPFSSSHKMKVSKISVNTISYLWFRSEWMMFYQLYLDF